IIPPSIVQSVHTSSPRIAARSVLIEPPTAVSDRQTELEADLQFLLDAQAEGLVKGLEGGLVDDQASTGSTTPTAQSVRSSSARRRSRPLRKKPGLRTARKGIYTSILALSAVKDEETHVLDAEAQEKEDTLAQIDEWEQKQQGLREATQEAHDGEEAIRAQRLQQEADVLQDEINAVEMQLADLKVRHRKLLRQAAAAENAVQAKLASYTSALGMIEADIQRFLSTKSAASETRQHPQDGTTSMWELPARRRTLEMAWEQWKQDKDVVLLRRKMVEHEKAALDEGAAVWQKVVTQVTSFERSLRASMADMTGSQSAWEDPPAQPQDNNERLRLLLEQLDGVIEHIDASLRLAEKHDWKLLIAAIGAEANALRQGKQILHNVL
ncbi:hypothetical protein BAUCODRAFT_51990, partial [Baudoinia panamericana UAMH 10762]